MPSNFKIDAQSRNKGVDGIVDQIDVGSGPGYMKIWTGIPPANTAAADTGSSLVQITLPKPCFGNGGASVVGEAIAASISGVAATGNGTAGHYRVYDSNGVCRQQGTAGIAADTPDLVFDDKEFVSGGIVNIDSWIVGVPES